MPNQKNNNHYDLVIIGGGPAGLSAAIYAARKKIKTLILTEQTGGQALLISKIENYAGIKSVSGQELINSMEEQVKNLGVEIIMGIKLKRIESQDGNFKVLTNQNHYLAKTVLVASGKTPRRLNVPGEKKLEKKGISFCSICDAPLYANKDVAVVGGGNSGLDAALDLTKYANKIYVLEFGDKLLGDELTQEKLKESGKVVFILNASTREIQGTESVEGLLYEDRKTKEIHQLRVGGVFVAIGSIPSTDFIKDLVALNDKKEIVIDKNSNATNVPGVFAAGDVTDIPFKQCIIAAGEGAKAALNIYEYLQNK